MESPVIIGFLEMEWRMVDYLDKRKHNARSRDPIQEILLSNEMFYESSR
jgi:hypothetical protein